MDEDNTGRLPFAVMCWDGYTRDYADFAEAVRVATHAAEPDGPDNDGNGSALLIDRQTNTKTYFRK